MFFQDTLFFGHLGRSGWWPSMENLIRGEIENRVNTCHLLFCDFEYSCCEANKRGLREDCGECTRITKNFFYENFSIEERKFLKPLSLQEASEWRFQDAINVADKINISNYLKSVAEFKTLTYMDFKQLGYGVISSLFTNFVRPFDDENIDLVKYNTVLKNLTVNSIATYLIVKSYIQKHNINKAYIWNGRMAYPRAVIAACQELGVDWYVVETGHKYGYYSKYFRTLAHDINCWKNRVRSTWQAIGNMPESREIANKFYTDRPNKALNDFINLQTKGFLPQKVVKNKKQQEKVKNIVVYLTTNRESMSISPGLDSYSLFLSQINAVKFLVEHYKGQEREVNLIIREHPNQKISNPALVFLTMPEYAKFVTLLTPDSPVDSYELMREADLIITFHSTIGIEAAYWKREKAIQLKPSNYFTGLEVTTIPRSEEELIKLLDSPPGKVTESNFEDVLAYGYYMSTFGDKINNR